MSITFYKGTAYKLKTPCTVDGVAYTSGYFHQMKGEKVLLLLEAGISPKLLDHIRVVNGRPLRTTDLIVEFSIEEIGKEMPFAFGGVYAGMFEN